MSVSTRRHKLQFKPPVALAVRGTLDCRVYLFTSLILAMFATRRDGFFLVIPGKHSQSPQTQRVVADLMELGTPILGIIVD